jgi:dTDP-4-amino-4,6-dideoxygalactose transaminase
MQIKFFKPYITGGELGYIQDLLTNHKDLSGDGEYTKKVHAWLEKRYSVPKVLLTTSGTTALEMAVRLLNLSPGAEIISPSFTFSSTVNAILMHRGLVVKFAEISPDTLNIDPDDIEKRITKKTKAIIVVHYAGVACDMDKIMKIAKKYKLKVIEDAAQAIEAKYKGKYLGTIGDIGCISFHDTKNITCGEGGALFINSKDKTLHEYAEILREKGTNRSKFFRGLIDKYTWVDIGSSYLPSEILAAFLLAQLEHIDEICNMRMERYEYYRKTLSKYVNKGIFRLPIIPEYAEHNAHIFYLIFKTPKLRDTVLGYLRGHGVGASFHYIPLHSAPQGMRVGFKKTDFPITTNMSERLLRLPLYADMTKQEQDFVLETLCDAINSGDEHAKLALGDTTI